MRITHEVIVMDSRMKKAAVIVTAVVMLGGAAGIGAVSAQCPWGAAGGATTVQFRVAPTVWSTTNYTDIAAKALGMTSTELRQALVGGKNLEQIASSKQVTIQTVEAALTTAREADLQQAVTDGLLTQQQYDQIKSRMDSALGNAAGTAPAPATPSATQQAAPNGQPQAGGPRGFFGLGGRFLGVPSHNVVNSYVVASKALNMSCPDLVKAMQGGQSIAQVATSKNVPAQTVIDALVAADKAAIAQDVQEGLLAQAQADGRVAQLVNRAGAFVYNTRPAGGRRGLVGGLFPF